ncbi:ankyrin repeat domain-containing protein [Alphaproteobacteria bacterium]|nr:ankyrin repeat domain-containing protein [Alphaproteobacteria bacterium]
MPTKQLPTSAKIKDLEHQANGLLSDFQRGEMSAYQRIREFHPNLGNLDDSLIAEESFDVSAARLSIAREYGYRSWAHLSEVVAGSRDLDVRLLHNDRIEDATFLHALELLDEGNVALLSEFLANHAGLVKQQVFFEGDNYFTDPTLLEFVAENPTRQGNLPDNIVEIARIILEAGAKHNQASLNSTLMLTASGSVARQEGYQITLLGLLCDYGADPIAGIHAALAHGEFDAVRFLMTRGAPLDLSTAAALNLQEDVLSLLGEATESQKQLGLALSAMHGRDAVVAMLLEADADPNRYNPPGGHSHCTPLHSAAFEGHLETVKILVESGARIDIGDIHRGQTALDWADYAQHQEIVEYLVSKKSPQTL